MAPKLDLLGDNASIATAIFDASLAPGGKLNAHQINAFAETVSVYEQGRGVFSAHILGNAAAFDPSAYPTGQIINYREDAKVDPLTLSPESMHYLVMCPVLPAADQVLDDPQHPYTQLLVSSVLQA